MRLTDRSTQVRLPATTSRRRAPLSRGWCSSRAATGAGTMCRVTSGACGRATRVARDLCECLTARSFVSSPALVSSKGWPQTVTMAGVFSSSAQSNAAVAGFNKVGTRAHAGAAKPRFLTHRATGVCPVLLERRVERDAARQWRGLQRLRCGDVELPRQARAGGRVCRPARQRPGERSDVTSRARGRGEGCSSRDAQMPKSTPLVLLGGCSAGGQGVLVNLDDVADYVPEGAQLLGFADGGSLASARARKAPRLTRARARLASRCAPFQRECAAAARADCAGRAAVGRGL